MTPGCFSDSLPAVSLTPEIEAEGLKAYEQVCAFERLRTWRLPLWYTVFPLIPALSGAGLWATGHTTLGGLHFLAAGLFTLAEWFHWKRLCERHAKNLKLLEKMEAAYGDRLPWVQVENHFAALDQLKRDLADEARKEEA